MHRRRRLSQLRQRFIYGINLFSMKKKKKTEEEEEKKGQESDDMRDDMMPTTTTTTKPSISLSLLSYYNNPFVFVGQKIMTTLNRSMKQQEEEEQDEENDDNVNNELTTTTTTTTQLETQTQKKKKKKKTTTERSPFLNWLLAAFTVGVLSWIVIFNVAGAHTNVGRYKIYPAFQSKYFDDDKSGARIFTFLGLYYIIAGTVILSCLAYGGIDLPKPRPLWLVSTTRPVRWCSSVRCCNTSSRRRSGEGNGGSSSSSTTYWTVLELIMIFMFVSMQIAVVITRGVNKYYNDWVPTWDAAKLWYEVTKTLGKTCAITMLFLFIPISKSCFWLDLFNLKFERAVKFHRWLAWFLVWVVLIHAACAVASLVSAGQFRTCMWPSKNCENPGQAWGTYRSLETSRLITYGWTCFVLAVPSVVTSFPWFRRHKFEWFYYTHFLFVPCMVLLHLHYPSMIYYAAPGLAAYTLDKVLFFCSSRRPIRIVRLTQPVRGYVRMEIAIDEKYIFEPGQWVQINVPAVSLLEWHPMTVASAPGHSTMTLDMKVIGDWTKKLQQLSERFDSTTTTTYAHSSTVFIDQFHGSSHARMQGYLNHPAILMVAGGIGITPMMSALRHLVEEEESGGGKSLSFPHVRRVVLVWIVRKQSVVDLYRDELGYFQSIGTTSSGIELQVLVHATLSEKEDENKISTMDVVVDSLVPPDSGAATSAITVSHHRRQWPLQRKVLGYTHLLILTVVAGGGYLLGIFLANFLAFDKEWRSESIDLLQLFLAVFFDALFVAIGMSPTSLLLNRREEIEDYDSNKPNHKHKEVEHTSSENSSPSWKDQGSLTREVYYQEHNNHEFLDEETPAPATSSLYNRVVGSQNNDLKIVLGCRPDLNKIVKKMSKWCKKNNCSSVGVSVCGPNNLINQVMSTCRSASSSTSSSTVTFLVDEETFEW